MKKSKIISLILSVCLLVGVFYPLIGVEAYEAGTSGKFLSLSSDELTNVAYSYSAGYIDLSDPDCSAHVDTSYLRFRIWVYFGDILPSGSEVTVSAEIRNGPGTIGTVQGFFAEQNGNNIYASQSLSQKGTFSFANGGLTTTDTTFVLTGDASAFVFDITYSSRSISQMYLDITKLLIRCTYQDVVTSELEDLNATSNNVLDNLKTMVTSIVNLPTKIADGLATFFNGIKNGLTDLGERLLDSLPDGFANAISGFFDSVKSAISGVAEDVFSFFADPIGVIQTRLNNVVENIKSLPTSIVEKFADFQEKVTSGLDILLSGDSNSDDLDNDTLDNFDSVLDDMEDVERPSIEEILTLMNELFPKVENTFNYIERIFGIIWRIGVAQDLLITTLIFSVMAYVLFGKR